MAHWENADISGRYAAYRPQYPAAVADHLATLVRELNIPFDTVMDVGCGTGQLSQLLLPNVNHLIGIDVSAAQLEQCRAALASSTRQPRIDLFVGNSSNLTLPQDVRQVDAVVVGQALHWFDINAFTAQLHRVLRPGGILVVLMYSLPRLEPAACDAVLREFDQMLLRDRHWTPERWHIVNEYQQLLPQLNLPLIDSKRFELSEDRTIRSVVQYVSTWSGLNRYIRATGDTSCLEKLDTSMVRAAGAAATVKLRTPIRMFTFRRLLPAHL